MKFTNIVPSLVLAGLVAVTLTACETEHEHEHEHEGHAKESEAQLKAEAKISESDARAIALAKVPNGTIKEGELEKEHGKLIWSFDIATPDTKDITEVNVDAITGDVVSMDKESAESEAKEAAEEKEKN